MAILPWYAALRRHVGHLDATALHVVLPAVVDAADAALLVAAIEEIWHRGAAQAGSIRPTRPCVSRNASSFSPRICDSQRRAIGLGQLARERDRKPVAAEVLAHGRAGAGAGEKLVVSGRKHYARLSLERYDRVSQMPLRSLYERNPQDNQALGSRPRQQGRVADARRPRRRLPARRTSTSGPT